MITKMKPTVRAVIGTAPKGHAASQPRTPMVGAGSLIASRGGELCEAITVRTYYGQGNGLHPLRACVWVRMADRTEGLSGRGSASGCGYHKGSAAIADAVGSCGIKLYGSAYRYPTEPVDFKKQIYFGGTGSGAYAEIFQAIARAAGYRGRMVWVSHSL